MRKTLFLCMLAASATTLCAAEADFAPEKTKKLIKFGWDNPTPAHMIEHFTEIERNMTPYDGMGIDFNSTTHKTGHNRAAGSAAMMFAPDRWEKSFFTKEIEQLKQANNKFKYLKHNFINANSMAVVKDRFDWFDDKLWAAITNNFGLLAAIARETGCKGLNIDIENYERQTFLYNPALGKSYEATWDKARQRGREFITAIAREYPEIVLHVFFWLDQNYVNADGQTSPYKKSEKWIMGLTLPFINGIYDALPETVTIVEGMESGGYRADNLADYQAIIANRSKKSKWLIDPKNYEKYLRRTQLGMATYLDRYIRTDPKSVWFISNDPVKNLAMLKRNLGYALYFADEYAWTWGETRSWYTWNHTNWMKKACEQVKRPGPLWENALPGITDAMIFAKDPHRFYQSRIEKNQFPANLARNPDFEQTASAEVNGVLPPECDFLKAARPWGFWQPNTSKGRVSVAPGEGVNSGKCTKFQSVGNGSILQGISLETDGAYFIRAKARTAGKMTLSLNIGWHDASGRWNFWGSNAAAAFSKDLGNGWKEASILLMKEQIPAGAKSFSVLISAKSPGQANDIGWVDQVEVYNLNRN